MSGFYGNPLNHLKIEAYMLNAEKKMKSLVHNILCENSLKLCIFLPFKQQQQIASPLKKNKTNEWQIKKNLKCAMPSFFKATCTKSE